MKIHDVIYVPGIGDDVKKLQSSLVKLWRVYGVNGLTHEMPWMDTAAYQPKLEKLLDLIDSLHAQGHEVSLVGTSAGAGAVINAFAARKDIVRGVVCIVGKVNNPDTIGTVYRQRSPAFLESAARVGSSLRKLTNADRKRIMSRFALLDLIVPRRDSIISGAINKTVPTFGHGFTIITQLFFGAPFFLNFLKKL